MKCHVLASASSVLLTPSWNKIGLVAPSIKQSKIQTRPEQSQSIHFEIWSRHVSSQEQRSLLLLPPMAKQMNTVNLSQWCIIVESSQVSIAFQVPKIKRNRYEGYISAKPTVVHKQSLLFIRVDVRKINRMTPPRGTASTGTMTKGRSHHLTS